MTTWVTLFDNSTKFLSSCKLVPNVPIPLTPKVDPLIVPSVSKLSENIITIIASQSDASISKHSNCVFPASIRISGKPIGAECPRALRLVACVLLFEITAFLRESYQSIPKTCRASLKERGPWDRVYRYEFYCNPTNDIKYTYLPW